MRKFTFELVLHEGVSGDEYWNGNYKDSDDPTKDKPPSCEEVTKDMIRVIEDEFGNVGEDFSLRLMKMEEMD